MTEDIKIYPATKRRMPETGTETLQNDKITVVAQELVITTYTKAEREMTRMLVGTALFKMTGIKRSTVQRFIDGKPMNRDTVQKLSHIIEVLKQL